MSPWQTRFRDAVAWAAPGVGERAAKHGIEVRYDRELGQEPPEDWAGEIDQMIVRGSKVHREAVFFHRASRTLILTDLIENFEPDKVGPFLRIATRIAGIRSPGGMPRDMRATFRDRVALREDVERMIAWGPERVILAHGRWYACDGAEELRRAFAWVL